MHLGIRPWEIDLLTADELRVLCERADALEAEAQRLEAERRRDRG